jgi:isoprenylcysteine carboxyl methyltransferase (ICMT) family protein YpbQ
MIETLARWRVGLGFATGVLVFVLARPTVRSLVAGTLVAILGEGVRVWAAGHLNKSREVTSSGPYRWTAHPLYVGSSIMGAGLAIGSGSLAAAVAIALYLGIKLTAAIRSEEAFLRNTFGNEYDRYRRREASGPAAGRRFSLSRAISNREHRAAIGLGVAVLLLLLKATYNGLFWRQPGG